MWGMICVEGFLSVGFEYMCRTGKQGRDRPGTDRLYVQDRRTGEGYGPDAGCMTKVRGEREQKVRPGPGVTSGLGGRGDLRRSSLGS